MESNLKKTKVQITLFILFLIAANPLPVLAMEEYSAAQTEDGESRHLSKQVASISSNHQPPYPLNDESRLEKSATSLSVATANAIGEKEWTPAIMALKRELEVQCRSLADQFHRDLHKLQLRINALEQENHTLRKSHIALQATFEGKLLCKTHESAPQKQKMDANLRWEEERTHTPHFSESVTDPESMLLHLSRTSN